MDRVVLLYYFNVRSCYVRSSVRPFVGFPEMCGGGGLFVGGGHPWWGWAFGLWAGGGLATFAVLYAMFHFGRLGRVPWLARFVGRVGWWPALPFSLLRARGKPAFDAVDGTVFLGRVVLPRS